MNKIICIKIKKVTKKCVQKTHYVTGSFNSFLCLSFQFSDLSTMMPSIMEKGNFNADQTQVSNIQGFSASCSHFLFLLFPDTSFSDDLASDGDMSRSMSEPAVKRERIEINHSLQEI